MCIGRFPDIPRAPHQLLVEGDGQALRQAFISLGGSVQTFTIASQANSSIATAVCKRYGFRARLYPRIVHDQLVGSGYLDQIGISDIKPHLERNVFNKKSGRGFRSKHLLCSHDLVTTDEGNKILNSVQADLSRGSAELWWHSNTKLESKSCTEEQDLPTPRLFVYLANTLITKKWPRHQHSPRDLEEFKCGPPRAVRHPAVGALEQDRKVGARDAVLHRNHARC